MSFASFEKATICIVFGLVYFGMIAGRFPYLKIGRTAIALVTATTLDGDNFYFMI
ncbi:MAG: hypothetical protein AB7F32_08300 [Victivallaceae bacterium]